MINVGPDYTIRQEGLSIVADLIIVCFRNKESKKETKKDGIDKMHKDTTRGEEGRTRKRGRGGEGATIPEQLEASWNDDSGHETQRVTSKGLARDG